MIIDSDGHVIEPPDLWDRYIDRKFYDARPICDDDDVHFGLTVAGKRMSRVGETPHADAVSAELRRRGAAHADAARRAFDAQSQIDAMDSEGIDCMLVFPSRGLYANAVGDLDPELSAAICRAYNRWASEFCSVAPDRLLPVAMGTLHDPKLGAEEAIYAIHDLGMKGVMVRPNPYSGRNLHDPAYEPFYGALEDLDVPLAIHEGCGVYMPEFGVDRFGERIGWHAMSHTMEMMGAIYSFTVCGVFERHPRLRTAFLEAGCGWLPAWLHRLDEHAEFYQATVPDLTMAPSAYFKRNGWISFEGEEPGLTPVIDRVGVDRFLWSSDYPHADGTWPGVVDELFESEEITETQRKASVADNPASLWRIPAR
jgi:predicted TIM-barrel fold metal-dependent hydrolase